jgi:hypothetical protein
VFDLRSARGKTSGMEVGQIGAKGAGLFHVCGGRVARLVIYGERNYALADLGLDSEDHPDSYTVRPAEERGEPPPCEPASLGLTEEGGLPEAGGRVASRRDATPPANGRLVVTLAPPPDGGHE